MHAPQPGHKPASKVPTGQQNRAIRGIPTGSYHSVMGAAPKSAMAAARAKRRAGAKTATRAGHERFARGAQP